MSKTILNASLREAVGTNKLKQLRNTGMVPGILYGSHMDATPISISKMDIDKFLAEHNVGSKVYVNLEGKEIMAFVKSVQKDVFKLKLLNFDLQALTMTDKVKMKVILNFTGKEDLPLGAIAQEVTSELEIESYPDMMLDTLSVDVSKLNFGDVVKVSDLDIMSDSNYKVYTSPDVTLFSLVHAKATELAETEVAEEAAAAVEAE